mgnify:CR=1 FL=1
MDSLIFIESKVMAPEKFQYLKRIKREKDIPLK